MSLSAGTKLGPYEIIAPLGAGGMGEVFRARDPRLSRDVAIKALPPAFAADAERLARFEREARLLASLNHPNVAGIHGVEDVAGTRYLVLEFVDGETLEARLARGPLALDEALDVMRQVAAGVETAHESGIVHRDLKPGNVMLTPAGVVKVLDFGLARSGEAGGTASNPNLSASPTMTYAATQAGMILGTAAYMSPEQARGKAVDRRTDVWSFGCVLYECLAGKRVYDGETVSDMVARILEREPDWSALPAGTPPRLTALLKRCLTKDAKQRQRDLGDARLELEAIAAGDRGEAVVAAATAPKKSPSAAFQIAAAVFVSLASVVATTFVTRGDSKGPPPVHAAIAPPAGAQFSSSVDSPLPLAISLDGSTIAFCARTGEGPDMLWVRSLNKNDARVLPGTEGANGPFFSPDGRSLAFFARAKLKRIEVAGGPVTSLADGIDPRGGSWGRGDVILLATGSGSSLSRIPAGGGRITAVTVLDTASGETTHRYPHLLPDGKHYLYLSRRSAAGAGRGAVIYAGTLGSGERKPVVEAASNVAYASGHLLYVRGTTLVAQPFDLRRLATTGPPVSLIEDARMDGRYSRAVFSASANGVLVCMTGNRAARSQLRWLDRDGRALGDVGEPAEYTYGGTPELSPDGRSAVMAIANPDLSTSDLWVVDVAGGRRRKFTVDTMDHPSAIWAPDGRSVLFTTVAPDQGGLYLASLDGTRSSRLIAAKQYIWPQTSHGDRVQYYADVSDSVDTYPVMEASLSGSSAPKLFTTIDGDRARTQCSPDGRWVACVSNETGRSEVYVMPGSSEGGRWQASEGGGVEPRWSRDGRELYYFDPDNQLVAVTVGASPGGFQALGSRKLFQFHGAGGLSRYDVAPDGRFLVATRADEHGQPPITLITGWPRKVAKR